MTNLWPKIAAVISALIVLYSLFGLLMLMPYTKLAGFKENLLFFIGLFVVSALIFVGSVIAWRRSSRGPDDPGLR
jgi:uncharacterized membrane protein